MLAAAWTRLHILAEHSHPSGVGKFLSITQWCSPPPDPAPSGIHQGVDPAFRGGMQFTADGEALMATKDAMATRIRKARLKASLTQRELADRLQIHRSAVAQWERVDGGTKPQIKHLTEIALITGVGFEWLAMGRSMRRKSTSQHSHTTLGEVETRCLDALRRLTPHQRHLVDGLLSALASEEVIQS